MSKQVNVDFVTRQIEVDTDGKEHFISAAMAAKDAEASMLNAQNAANHAEVQAEIAKENADHADRIISAGFLLANNLTIKDGKICVVYKEG